MNTSLAPDQLPVQSCASMKAKHFQNQPTMFHSDTIHTRSPVQKNLIIWTYTLDTAAANRITNTSALYVSAVHHWLQLTKLLFLARVQPHGLALYYESLSG